MHRLARWKILRPEELGALIALLLLVVAQWHWRGSPRLDTYFARRGGLLLAGIALAHLLAAPRDEGRGRIARVLEFARDWAPFVALILVYENLLPLVSRIRPELYDPLFLRLDRRLFGETPSLWLEPLVSHARSEWFAACYMLLFALPLSSGGALYLTGRRREFRRFMSAFTFAGVVGYLGYLALPVVGPRYYFGALYHVGLNGAPLASTVGTGPLVRFAEHASQLPNAVANHVPNCFPSLHTTWGLIALVFAYRQQRWLFWLYLVPVTSLIFATLYLRFHYLVDVLAGGLLAAATCALFLSPRREQMPPAAPAAAPFAFPRQAAALLRSGRAFIGVLATVPLVYWSSLPSGLTEKNRGQDGAELVAAAVTGGTAHPPGYPLYALLVRAATGIAATRDPIDVAHALSAVFGVGAALVLCWSLRRWLAATEPRRPELVDLAAYTGAVAYSFCRPVFAQALVAEVYALHGLLLALVVGFAVQLRLDQAPRPAVYFGFGFCASLGVTHHLSALPIVLGLVVLLVLARLREQQRACVQAPFAAIGGALLGASPWLLLVHTARSRPALSWGNPDTGSRFWALVSAEQYRSRLSVKPVEALARLADHFPSHGYTALTLGLATLGVVEILRQLKKLQLCAGAAVFATTAIANSASAALYDIPDLDAYFIPTAMALAAFAAFGVLALARGLDARSPFAAELAAAITAVALIGTLLANWRVVDAHGRAGLDRRVSALWRSAPPNALILARGDAMVFGLWYEKFVRAPRPDVDVVSRELLSLPWYPAQRNHFSASMRWPSRPLHGAANERLRSVLRANYGHRPIVVVHSADVPPACTREGDGTLRCESRTANGLTVPVPAASSAATEPLTVHTRLGVASR